MRDKLPCSQHLCVWDNFGIVITELLSKKIILLSEVTSTLHVQGKLFKLCLLIEHFSCPQQAVWDTEDFSPFLGVFVFFGFVALQFCWRSNPASAWNFQFQEGPAAVTDATNSDTTPHKRPPQLSTSSSKNILYKTLQFVGVHRFWYSIVSSPA